MSSVATFAILATLWEFYFCTIHIYVAVGMNNPLICLFSFHPVIVKLSLFTSRIMLSLLRLKPITKPKQVSNVYSQNVCYDPYTFKLVIRTVLLCAHEKHRLA